MIDGQGAEAHLRMRVLLGQRLRMRLLLGQRVGQRRGLLVLQLGGGSCYACVVDAASKAEHALSGGPLQATHCCGLGFAGLTRGGAVPCERRPGAVGALVAACKEISCAVTTSTGLVQTVPKPTVLAPQISAQQLPRLLQRCRRTLGGRMAPHLCRQWC